MDITAHPEDHPGEPNKFDKDWAEGPFAMRHLVMKNDEEDSNECLFYGFLPSRRKKNYVKC